MEVCLESQLLLGIKVEAKILILAPCNTTLHRGDTDRGSPDLIFYIKLILLRLFQQQYCHNITGQSHESDASLYRKN